MVRLKSARASASNYADSVFARVERGLIEERASANVVRVLVIEPGPDRTTKQRRGLANEQRNNNNNSNNNNGERNEPRRHVCEVCDKGFDRPSHLDTHMLVHNGLKPFKCRFCDYACTTNSSLKRHMNTRHNDQMETED